MAEGGRGYHHGNLREALVDAAAQLIEAQGPLGFTLAEASRVAGVSPAAPYRHFRGRDELLAEVARQGFVDFAARLEAAFGDGRPNALAAFMRVGAAYLDFARERPGHYIAMFESGQSGAADPGLRRAAEAADAALIRATEALFARMPAEGRPPARMVANHVFALSHGVVELFSRGRPGARSPIPPAELLESGVLIYLRGLGIIAG